MAECSVAGCGRPKRANGMCTLHDQRMKKHGSTDPRPRSRGSLAVRFWRKVDTQSGPNGCWLWTGGTHKRGYGTLADQGGKTIAAHRYSYEMHNGAIPDGLWVRHKCDNPNCVNPEHLTLGTPTDNVRDMWERGRAKPKGPKGERSSKSKLTPEQVRAVRADATKNNHEWARELGVTPNSIRAIRTGQTWTHID
jgi:DNA-binding transcriptional regulator YiaG